jgi:hypothetical protein
MSVPLAQMTPGHGLPCANCGTVITFAGQDASKVQKIIDELSSQIPGVSVEVKVKTKRPWWKFWGA